MNRKQTEKMIAGLMRQIVNLYHIYDPDGDYLSLAYLRNEDGRNTIMIDNCAHKADCPIDYKEDF